MKPKTQDLLEKQLELRETALGLMQNVQARERISWLFENKNFATEPLGYIPAWNGFVYSNCHGTALFARGFNEECEEQVSDGGLPLLVLRKNRPGYINGDLMTPLMEIKCQKVSEPAELDFVCFYGQSGQIFALYHTVVYLGKQGDQDLVFHQKNFGKEFEIISIGDILNEDRKTGDFQRIQMWVYRASDDQDFEF